MADASSRPSTQRTRCIVAQRLSAVKYPDRLPASAPWRGIATRSILRGPPHWSGVRRRLRNRRTFSRNLRDVRHIIVRMRQIAGRHQLARRRRQLERTRIHSERSRVGSYVLGERTSGDSSDHSPSSANPRFEYLNAKSGSIAICSFGIVARTSSRVGNRVVLHDRWRLTHQSRSMSQQAQQRHVLDRTEGVANRAELGNETHKRIVETKLSLVPQLHNSGGREGLADRSHQEQRVLVNRTAAGDIGQAESLLPNQFWSRTIPIARPGGRSCATICAIRR